MNDISHILDSWKYSEHDINVRLIRGTDGRPKVQMRLDLGLLQMELDGRPDGRQPRSFESYLDFFEAKAKKNEKRTAIKPFTLSPMDCFKLQQEAIQYYHRYLALMKLRDYPRVSRDTTRNLRVFDFIEHYADNEEIVWQFQQHRPYVIMMNARARAMMELDRDHFETAMDIIRQGIADIEEYNDKWGDQVGPDFPELEFLTYWLDEINEQKPLSEEERLKKELDEAVAVEDYELAAALRDQLSELDK